VEHNDLGMFVTRSRFIVNLVRISSISRSSRDVDPLLRCGCGSRSMFHIPRWSWSTWYAVVLVMGVVEVLWRFLRRLEALFLLRLGLLVRRDLESVVAGRPVVLVKCVVYTVDICSSAVTLSFTVTVVFNHKLLAAGSEVEGVEAVDKDTGVLV